MAVVNVHLLEALLSLLRDVVEEGHDLGAAVGDLGIGLSLTRAELHTLSLVVASPGVGVTELAAQQAVTRSATSQMVSRLVKKGLLTRERGDSGRTLCLGPTALGLAACQAHQRQQQQQQAVVRPVYLSNEQIQRDIEALVRMQDILRRCASLTR